MIKKVISDYYSACIEEDAAKEAYEADSQEHTRLGAFDVLCQTRATYAAYKAATQARRAAYNAYCVAIASELRHYPEGSGSTK